MSASGVSSRRALPRRSTPGCGATGRDVPFCSGWSSSAAPPLWRDRPRAARDQPWRERGAGGGRARRSEHAVRPGAGRRGQGVDRRSARELGLSRRPGREAVRGLDHQHDLRVRLQALEPRNFSGPLWQDLTGIGFNVEELPHPDQYSKPIAEHIAGSGAFDILDIEPAWIPRWRTAASSCRSTTTSSSTWTRPTSRTSIPVPVPADLQGQALGLLRR